MGTWRPRGGRQEQDRLANLKWRDPAMAETVDELARARKGGCALAKASGEDAELVEAVNQAGKRQCGPRRGFAETGGGAAGGVGGDEEGLDEHDG